MEKEVVVQDFDKDIVDFPQASVYVPEESHLVVVEDDGEAIVLAVCLTCGDKHPNTPKRAEEWAEEHRNTQHYERVIADRF